MRRRLVLTGVLALAFAASVSAEEAAKAPPPMEAYVPSDAVLYVHYQGLAQAATTFRQTDLYRILQEPEVQAFGAELSRFMDALLKEKAEDSPVQWADIQLIYNSEIAFALMDFRGTIPSVALIVRGGDKAGEMSKLLDRLIDKATGGHAEGVAEADIDGVSVKQVGPISVAQVSGDLVIASSQETMRRMLRAVSGKGASLLKNDRYAAAAKKFGAEKEFLTAFFNVERFTALMKDLKGADLEDFNQVWKVTGMTDVDYVRLAVAPDSPGVKVSFYVHAPMAKGLFRVFPTKPLDEKTMLAGVPQTADDFFIARCSPEELYDAISEMVALAGENEGFDAAIADFNQAAGFDLRKDLLGSLGDETTLRTIGPGFLFFPEFYVSVGVKDEKKLNDCLDKLVVVAGEAAGRAARPDHLAIETERINYKGLTIVALKFVGLPIPATPSYCISKGRMYIAATPQTLKKTLDQQASARPMVDSAAWAALRSHVAAKPSALVYSEFKTGFDQAYGGLATLLVQMTNGIPDVPKHSLATKFPTSMVVTPHVSGSLMALSHDGEGYLFESYGTFGGGTIPGNGGSLATTGMMAGFLLPALSKAREAARRASCMNNIRQIGLAMFQYAGDHDDKFPDSFGVLLHDGYLTTPKVFLCPSSRRVYNFPDKLLDFKNADVKDLDKALEPFLSYVRVSGIDHTADAETIILYEKDGAHTREGRNCFFNDGHVEWVWEDRFQLIRAEQKKRLAGEQ